MAHRAKLPPSTQSRVETTAGLSALRWSSDRREQASRVLDHVERAKLRKTGKDVTAMTAEELIADLRAHRTLG
jgi:hypothetical protein